MQFRWQSPNLISAVLFNSIVRRDKNRLIYGKNFNLFRLPDKKSIRQIFILGINYMQRLHSITIEHLFHIFRDYFFYYFLQLSSM